MTQWLYLYARLFTQMLGRIRNGPPQCGAPCSRTRAGLRHLAAVVLTAMWATAVEDIARMLESLKGRAGPRICGGVYHSCVARGPNQLGPGT